MCCTSVLTSKVHYLGDAVILSLTRTANPAKIAGFLTEGYPSGQRGQTVNLLSYDFGGSNPPPSTSFMFCRCLVSRRVLLGFVLLQKVKKCGNSSMVEHQFSKLITRVRFPLSAPLNCAANSAI